MRKPLFGGHGSEIGRQPSGVAVDHVGRSGQNLAGRVEPSVRCADEIVVEAVAVDVADRGDALAGAIALAGAVDALVGLVPKIGLAGRDVQPLRRQRRQVAHGDQLVLIGGEAPEARGSVDECW